METKFQQSADTDASEAERFDDALKHLLTVPKEELDRREEEYKRQRDEARGHKRPLKKKPTPQKQV